METAAASAPAPAVDPAREIRLFGTSDSQLPLDTPSLISAMIESGKGISDLIFSPGRPLQVERHGELTAVDVPGLEVLEPADTSRIARDLIGGNPHSLETLENEGAVDLPYSIPSRTQLTIFGPKPTAKASTFMPHFRATKKWPHS